MIRVIDLFSGIAAIRAEMEKALALEMRISPGYLSEVRAQAQGDAYGSLPDG